MGGSSGRGKVGPIPLSQGLLSPRQRSRIYHVDLGSTWPESRAQQSGSGIWRRSADLHAAKNSSPIVSAFRPDLARSLMESAPNAPKFLALHRVAKSRRDGTWHRTGAECDDCVLSLQQFR